MFKWIKKIKSEKVAERIREDKRRDELEKQFIERNNKVEEKIKNGARLTKHRINL